jgi:hypothetical protein
MDQAWSAFGSAINSAYDTFSAAWDAAGSNTTALQQAVDDFNAAVDAAYSPLSAAYDAAVASANAALPAFQAALDAATAAAGQTWNAAIGTALAAYNATEQGAWANYMAAEQTAWDTYVATQPPQLQPRVQQPPAPPPDPTLRLQSLFWPYPIEIRPNSSRTGAEFSVPLMDYQFRSLPLSPTFKMNYNFSVTPSLRPGNPWFQSGGVDFHLVLPSPLDWFRR